MSSTYSIVSFLVISIAVERGNALERKPAQLIVEIEDLYLLEIGRSSTSALIHTR